jgi:hypothetical protein
VREVALWILLAIFGNLVFSGASFLDKKVVGRISPYAFLALSELALLPVLIGIALLSPWFSLAQPFLGQRLGQGLELVFPGWNFLFVKSLLAGLSVSAAFLFYARAMRMMVPSRVVMFGLVASSCSAAGIGMLVRGRMFTPLELAAFGLLLGGGWLASFLLYEEDPLRSAGDFKSGFWDIMIAGFFWGLYPSLVDNLKKDLPWFSLFFWQNFAGVIFALFLCLIFRSVVRECKDAVLRAMVSEEGSQQQSFRLLRYFVCAKLLGIFGGYSLAFAMIFAPVGKAAFVPVFGGVRYAAAFCWEHFRAGRGIGERIRLLATFRMLILLVAAAMIAGGIFILALYAKQPQ